MKFRFYVFMSILVSAATFATAEELYVTTDTLNVRLCPDTTCPITNKLHLGAKITVFERKGKWARISDFYDASAERAEFPQIKENVVARWVSSSYLSNNQPSQPDQPELSKKLLDPRIQGIPEVAKYGLTQDDVIALRSYAAELLASGECYAIKYGDKSVSKPNTYFIQCEGETNNRYFTK